MPWRQICMGKYSKGEKKSKNSQKIVQALIDLGHLGESLNFMPIFKTVIK